MLPTTVHTHEPFAEYLANAQHYISSHQLQDFQKSPYLFWKKRNGLIPDSDSTAFIIGRAAHTLILEGHHEFLARYAVGGPINESTGKPYGQGTKAYQQWMDAVGLPAITREQCELIEQMAAAVASCNDAYTVLNDSDGIAEAVVRAEYCGLKSQIRIDWIAPLYGIADLKTCDDLTWFEADTRRYGYHKQMAFYRAVFAEAAGMNHSDVPCYLIAVEKKEPFRAGVWKLSDSTLAMAETENEKALEQMVGCFQSNTWPTGYETARIMEVV